MIEPLNFAFDVRISGTFDGQIEFFSDEARTNPFDFSGWSFEFTVYTNQGPIVGSVSEASGVVTLGLDSTQTSALTQQLARYTLAITRGTSPVEREFLAVGRFSIKGPGQL
jgi:hypothetical protein